MAATKIRGITIELNADTAGILDGLKDINKSLTTTTKGLNDVNKLLKLDPDNITLLAQKQDYLTDAIDKTKQKLEEEKRLLETMKSAENSAETIEQQKALEREIEATSQKLDKYQTELDDTQTALKGMGNEAEKAGKGFETTTDAIAALASSEAFSRISEDAKALLEVLLACDEAADKFETSMAKVETLAHAGTGLTTMADEIKKASAEIGVSSSDMAEAVYQAMSAGVDSGKAVKFAADASRLAIGGFTDTATAVDIVTTALNAYDLEMEDSAHIMDDLITTQNLGKTTVAELAMAMGKVIPTASAYNVNIDNLASAYAELTAKGIRTRETTTYLNAMFSELSNSEKEVNEILVELTGQTFGQYMAAGNSVGDAMKLLWEYADKDKESFMGLWSTTQAGKAAFNLASDGGEKFNEILVQMKDNAGELDEAFGIMADTSEMLDARFNTAVENLQIAIGDALGPMLDALKEKGLEVLEPVTEFIKENPSLVAAISGMVVGITGVTTAVTACAAAVSLLKIALGDIQGIAAIIGGAAIVGGFAGLSAALSGAASEAERLDKSIKKTKESIESSSNSYHSSVTDVHNLLQKIQALNAQEHLNATQKAELAVAVEKWNAAMGENSQLILDETGHIKELNGALSDNLEYAYKQYVVAQQEEERAKILEKLAQTEEDITEAQEQYNEAMAQYEKYMSQGANESAMVWKDLMDNASDATERAKDNQEELTKQWNKLTDAINAANPEIEENSKELEANAEAAAAAQKASEEYAEALQKEKEALDNTIESQVRSFEAITEGSAIAKEKLLNNLEDNVAALEDWANNLEILAARGISDSLLKELASLGPEGAAQVREFVDMTGDELEQANNAWDKAIKESLLVSGGIVDEYMTAGTNATQKWIDGAWVPINDGSLDSLVDGYTEHLTTSSSWDKLPLAVQEKLRATQETVSEAVNEEEEPVGTALADNIVDSYTEELETRSEEISDVTQTGITDPIKNKVDEELQMSDGGGSQVATNWGAQIDDSLAKGITENTGYITTATNTMIEQMIKDVRTKLGFDEQMTRSQVFYELGMQVDQSIADGMVDNQAVVAAALQSVFDNAIGSLDLSGISSAINSALGAALGG